MEHQKRIQNSQFQYFSPYEGVLTAFDRNPMTPNFPFSIDDDNVSNMFTSLNLNSDGQIAGAGEGSGHLFSTHFGFDESFRGPRVYSSVGHVNPLTVDPHLHHYHHPLLHNNRGVFRSSGFDQPTDFDQLSDLLRKEQFYSNLDETFIPNYSRSVNDNVNMVSSKLRNYQVLNLLSLKELRGRIYSLAKDQIGCRLLQAKFENPTNEEIDFLLYEVLDSISDLMKDQFGNYLIQKLIAVCNDDHKLRILLSLTDVPVEMVLVCMNPHGTRAMQKLLENLTDPYQIALAMAALRPGAARLANDPNGHHVIQYCLIHFPSNVNEPILNEIAHKCFDVATEKSGCCVLQACIEHSRGEVRNRLVSEILASAIHLAKDPYGNYVLQHMVGLNVPKFTVPLVRQLQGNFASLSCNKYASNVVEKCLNESGEEISRKIVMELISSPNPSLLLTHPYANFVIQSALTVSTGLVYDCLLELISDNMSSMRSNLYGKKILAWFEKRRILGI